MVKQWTIKSDDLLWPTLKALEAKGGSASIQELLEQITSDLGLSDQMLEVPHKEGGTQSEFEFRSAWARTALKKIGAVDNTSKGVWTITERGRQIQDDNQVRKINREWWNNYYTQKAKCEDASTNSVLSENTDSENVDISETDWREELLDIVRGIEPDAFERLCQRILRESGFTKVEVTGKSGDGGIDGAGVLRVNLLSFHVRFQCKKYTTKSVSVDEIRSFRGAMDSGTDKGLFITTGRFTRGAEREAVEAGKKAIDLINGFELCDLLKQFQLGVTTESVERITPHEEFFSSL